MRVAIVHEWLDTVAGSESVTAQLLHLFPNARLFSIVDFVRPGERGFLQGRQPRTTFIQHLPFARRHFRSYLPLMPLAVEQLDLSSYDLILSSSHAFAKGVITGPRQVHICYCHTPIRYAWDLQETYLAGAGIRGVRSWFARAVLHYIRLWDVRTAHGVDEFVANSHYVARRIRKTYGREAVVIHPPVDTGFFYPPAEPREDWYVTVSRMAPYKRTDLLVQAFSRMPDRRLVVIGDGPQLEACRRMAGPNISFRGSVSREEMRDALQRARAFVFAAEEDFGIAPVEAQACGTPVVAFGAGGVLDSIVDGVTGVFFEKQEPEAIHEAVRRFETMRFNEHLIRANAERFSIERFRIQFMDLAKQSMAAFRATSVATTA